MKAAQKQLHLHRRSYHVRTMNRQHHTRSASTSSRGSATTHSDCFWPDAPEQVLAELTAAGADDGDMNKITWENACNFFRWDPFARTPREQANVGALRAKATDVDVSIRPRKEWARLYAEMQLTKA